MSDGMYSDSAPSRDARIASGFVRSELMEQIEAMEEKHPEKVSSTQRLSLGHYQVARAAAERVARGEKA